MDALIANNKIKEVIDKLLKNKHTELSIGIVYDNQEYIFEYQKQSDDYYDIGSISKIFTSLIILKAAHNGVLNLNDEINKYLDLDD